MSSAYGLICQRLSLPSHSAKFDTISSMEIISNLCQTHYDSILFHLQQQQIGLTLVYYTTAMVQEWPPLLRKSNSSNY